MCLDSQYGEEMLELCRRIKVLLDKKSGFEDFYKEVEDKWFINCSRFDYAEDNIDKIPFLLFGECHNWIWKFNEEVRLKLKGLCLVPYSQEVSEQFARQFYMMAGLLHSQSHQYTLPCQVNTVFGIKKIIKTDAKEFFYVYALFRKNYYTPESK